jgi:hypothetical protein
MPPLPATKSKSVAGRVRQNEESDRRNNRLGRVGRKKFLMLRMTVACFVLSSVWLNVGHAQSLSKSFCRSNCVFQTAKFFWRVTVHDETVRVSAQSVATSARVADGTEILWPMRRRLPTTSQATCFSLTIFRL